MEKKRGVLVLERGMNTRFKEFALEHKMPAYFANLQNNFKGNRLNNFLSRLGEKEKIIDTIKEIEIFIQDNNLTQIFVSSAEGFVSYNVIFSLKKSRKNVEIIALQHGIFPLQYSKIKEFARGIVNRLVMFFFNLFPFGAGFGGIKLDEYYVYSNREKEFLINHRGWSERKVKVAPNFIKVDLLKKFNSLEIAQSHKNAVFLGQCLNLVGLCSEKMENYYSQTIINSLSRRYEKLFVKGHPSCSNILGDLKLPENVVYVDDMLVGFSKCKTAYSFFSTALIDAKIFNLKTVGIVIDELKVESEIYENFDLKLRFEELVST